MVVMTTFIGQKCSAILTCNYVIAAMHDDCLAMVEGVPLFSHVTMSFWP